MIIRQWGAAHHVPFAALLELEHLLGIAGMTAMVLPENNDAPGSEGRQQSLVRLEAAEKGVMLFRNNVGGMVDQRGRVVRYGLANESEKQNDTLKSADLIGWRARIIQPEWVGLKIAQFVSRELKKEDWVFDPGDEHEAAQLNWANLVLADGGDAAFATGPGTL